MQLKPYIFFNGQCEAAFKFYEKCLNGKIEAMITHEGTPAAEHVPAEWRTKIMHARLDLGNGEALMASDAPPRNYKKPEGFSVSLEISDPKKADRVFQELGENGTIKMPIQETFWAQRFGMLEDRFGIPWMINCSKAA